MALAGIVIALLGTSEVSLVVFPGAPCVTQARLVTRLESAGLRVVEGTSPRLAVTLHPEAEGVVVRAKRQGTSFERAVPARVDDCGAVERVVAALITSWSVQLPSPEVPEQKRVASRPSAPRVAEEKEVELPPAPEVEEQTPPPAAPPPDRKPLPAGASAPAETPPAVEVSSAPVKPSVAPLKIELAALGGGSVGPTPSVAGVGQLQLGLSFGRFGALLEGGLQSARSAEVPPIRVESTSQWLSLSGRVTFQPAARLRLDLALGLRVWRIAAQSFNTLNPGTAELVRLGGVASVGGSVHLAGPFAVQLRGFTSVRAGPRPRFLIEGLGPLIDLQPWEGGLLLGLEVRLPDGA